MACEIPVLGSNTPGMKEIIEKTKCGLVYFNDESFVNCILSLYNTPVEKQEEMGIKGRRFVEANLTWTLQVTKTINFIKELKIQ
jgi:glycosyltransferase involved in cell wall biosynthesis